MKKRTTDILIMILGGVLYGIAFNLFLSDNQIAPGGISGLSLALNYILKIPTGIISLCLNLPLLFFAMRYIGGDFVVKTLIATASLSLSIDAMSFLPCITGDPLIAALFGGVLMGVGLSLTYMRGASTGGIDIIAKLIQKRAPHISYGTLLFAIDVAIILTAALIFQNITTVFYAAIAVFVSTKAVDTALTGMNTGKVAFVFSRRANSIAKAVMTELERGVTMLKSIGGYSGEEKTVLLCAVRPHQIYKLRSIVSEKDGDAFVIFTDASQVLGEGFTEKA